MAITNLYPNLPAHLVQFKDGGLTSIESPTEDKSGKSLLLLGTAFDGPIMEPVQVDSSTVSKVFGSEVDEAGISNGATLTKYAKQAFKNGFHDVRCMRVTGTNASVKIVKSTITNQYEEEREQQFNIPGNLRTIKEGHAPMVLGTFNCTIDGVSQSVLSSPDSGLITFREYSARAYADAEVTYSYFDIQEKEFEGLITKVVPDDDEDKEYSWSFDNINLEDGEFLYIPETDPVTGRPVDQDASRNTGEKKGVVSFKINSGETEYEPLVDCQLVSDNTGSEALNNWVEAKFDADEIEVAEGDVATFKVLVAKKIDVVEDYVLDGDYEDMEFELTDIATANSFSIEGKEESVDYTINDNKITFLRAGKWPMTNANNKVIGTYTTTITETKEDSFIVNSKYGGSIYNGATIEFSTNTDGTTRVTFTKPVDKVISNADLPFYYDTPAPGESGVTTIGQLREQLDNYSFNNVFDIVTDDDTLEIASFPTGVYTLVGGTDGVNVSMDDMFKALSGKRYTQADADNGDCTQAEVGYLSEQGAYQYLENYNVDFIIPVGVYADVVPPTAATLHTTFHDELATVCAVLTYRTKMTHGFIDVKPNTNTTLKGVQNYVEHLLTYDNIHYMSDQDGNILTDSEGERMDIGWYTSVVVGPDPIMVSDKLGKYYGSPAIGYAALCSSLKPESAPTNKAIPGAIGMRFAFSNKQMNELVGNKFVVFKTKNVNESIRSTTPYVVDGCTAGAPSSDYGRISTVKIVTDVVDQIREVCEPFLGEPNTIEQRNAMSALISKRLSKIMEDGEINYYEFQVDATIQQVILGECTITLVLVVPMELRKITTTVALRASA